LRDIKLEDTFRHQFTTRAFATGVPTVLAGTPALSVLEENNATPITAGVTVSVDRASVVGLNEVTVIATAANGYEVGKSYGIYISTGTVGGVSVIGEVVHNFTIELAPVNWARVTAPTTAVDLSATDIQLVDTTTTNTDMRGTDSALLAANINLSAGVVESNLLQMGGVVQSGTDLKDFADASSDGSGLTEAGGTGDHLTAINLPNQTMDIVGNITGNLSGSVGSVTADVGITATAVDNIWDEVLTGATHNVTDSAGRRLRDLQEFGVYEGGAVWIDTVNGTAGTTDFESGTAFNPVDSIADANTLAASLGLSRFQIASGSTITFAATQTNQIFTGDNWTLALGGQSIIGTTIMGADVSGVASGVGTKQTFKNCILGVMSHVKNTHLINCGLSGNQTIVEAGDFFYDQCHSAVPNTGTVTFDFGAALNSSNLNVRHHSGGWNVENMGAGTGTYNATFEGDGQIIWAASCSATSNASIRGEWRITDNASGAVTETLDDNQTAVDAIGTPVGADISADIAAVKADTVIPEKNVAFSNIYALMVDSTDHVTPKTGLTLTVQRSLDGGAFISATGTAAEISNGMYQFDATAADMNGDTITFRFSGTAADDTFLTIVTR